VRQSFGVGCGVGAGRFRIVWNRTPGVKRMRGYCPGMAGLRAGTTAGVSAMATAGAKETAKAKEEADPCGMTSKNNNGKGKRNDRGPSLRSG